MIARTERRYERSHAATPTPLGFDAASDRYDADEAGNVVLWHMRRRVFRLLTATFARHARLLELGSGTGTDAAKLASEHASQVALVDVSPRLLERASGKVRAAGGEGLLGVHQLPARSVSELTRVYGPRSFDGAYSNFGPLNCEPDLRPVARGLKDLVRPGGALILSIINRWCPMEVGWFALHGQLNEARRRWGGPVLAAAYPGGPKNVETFYYSRKEIERAFSPGFAVEHVEALPLLLPPPYLDFVVARFEPWFRRLEYFEERAARMPLMRELGDHTLLRLRRRKDP